MSDAPARQFQFKRINTLIMVVLVLISLYLAYWQAGRVAEKTQIQAEHDALLKAEALTLNKLDQKQLMALSNQPWQPVSVEGEFLKSHGFYLDSQVYKGKAGYHYLVPLRFKQNQVILVNLGWIAAGNDRSKLPAFPEINIAQPVLGQLSKARTAMSGFEQSSESKVQLFINYEALSDKIGAAQGQRINMLPMVLLLSEDLEGGLPREWPVFEANIAMHEFYVAHWLIVALIIVFLYFYFAFKTPKHD